MKAHVSEDKKKVVKELVTLIDSYPIIGSIDMMNLPASQLNQLKAKLRGFAEIRMAKRRLMKYAFEASKKKGIDKLDLRGMPALIFTKENPFKLCKQLDKGKTASPAKAGQTAPKDIIVPAGPTGFAPGPIISELSSVGLKTGVEGGKIAIKEDKLLVKEGEVINAKLADVLGKLKIEPMEIGLNLVTVYENESIIPKSVLSIDEAEYENNFTLAAQESRNLAMEIAYPIKELIEELLSKAHNEAKTLALEEDLICDETVEKWVGEAEMQAKTLQAEAKIETTADKVEKMVEETKENAEGKKELTAEAKEAPKEEAK